MIQVREKQPIKTPNIKEFILSKPKFLSQLETTLKATIFLTNIWQHKSNISVWLYKQ